LQDDREVKWVWTLHASKYYIVSSAYSYLTEVDDNYERNDIQFLWLKAVTP